MSNFWTDLNRMIAAYEHAEAADEAARDEWGDDWQQLALDPELRTLIPGHLVTEAVR